MTPYEPRHEKTSLGTDHLIFFLGGGGGAGFFPQDFLTIKKNRDFFFSQSESRIFFSGQSKNKICFFFLNSIYARNVFFLDLYVCVFLEPNVHGYIVYMFVYTSCILDIWVEPWHDKTNKMVVRPAKTQISEAPPPPPKKPTTFGNIK